MITTKQKSQINQPAEKPSEYSYACINGLQCLTKNTIIDTKFSLKMRYKKV